MSDNARQHLETLIQLHQSNLQRLEIQAAGHGAMDVPLHIDNQIEAERQEILRLQSQLSTLKGPSKSPISSPQSNGQQPIASFSSPPVIPQELQYSFADRFAYISASQRSLLIFILMVGQEVTKITFYKRPFTPVTDKSSKSTK